MPRSSISCCAASSDLCDWAQWDPHVIEVTERDGAVVFLVRVQPRASRTEIVGEWQGGLKIRLTSPPVDDRANEELCRLLAERLNIPVAAVRILSGAHSRTKRVEVRGVSAERIRELV